MLRLFHVSMGEWETEGSSDDTSYFTPPSPPSPHAPTPWVLAQLSLSDLYEIINMSHIVLSDDTVCRGFKITELGSFRIKIESLSGWIHRINRERFPEKRSLAESLGPRRREYQDGQTTRESHETKTNLSSKSHVLLSYKLKTR